MSDRPCPDWLLDSIAILPVSVKGSPVKLMSVNELAAVATRLSNQQCWLCGRELDESTCDEMCRRCRDIEREAMET
jgi:hypothetical protein